MGLFVKRAEPQKKEELMKTKSRQELKKQKTRKEKKMQTKKQPSGIGQELKAVINNKQRGEKIMNEKQIEERLAEFKLAIKGIAAKLTNDFGLREDVFQVGKEAIYRRLMKGGDYNEAYLRQHAKHRMFNYLAAGKSIDNGFRKITKVELVNGNTGKNIDIDSKEDFLGGIYASDLKDLVNKRLSGLTKKVFAFLCEGYTQNEIAQKLNTYQKNISRQKKIIQNMARKIQ